MLFIACHEFLSCGFQVGGMAGHDHRNGRARPRVFVFLGGGACASAGGQFMRLRRCVTSCYAFTHLLHPHIG